MEIKETVYKVLTFSKDHAIGDNGVLIRTNPFQIAMRGKYPKGLLKSDGYRMYMIQKKWHYAHRLVATHFIPNPKNLTDVNHKNGVKSDNWVANLEWLSHSDNIKHSYAVLGRKIKKGADHWLHGKEATEETRKRMSEAAKLRWEKRSRGEGK